jgi:hypothetical protein
VSDDIDEVDGVVGDPESHTVAVVHPCFIEILLRLDRLDAHPRRYLGLQQGHNHFVYPLLLGVLE